MQIIIIHHFCFYRERLAVKRCRRHLHLLAAQIVFHRHNRVGKLVCALEFAWFTLLLRPIATRAVGETLVHLIEIFTLIVERFKIDFRIEIPHSIVGNRVAHHGICHIGTAVPTIGRIIRHVSVKEVKKGYFAERSFIGCRKRLTVIPRRSEITDAAHHRVAPFLILVGEQFLIHLSHRFLDARHRVGVKRQCQRFCKIPSDCKLTVPIKILAHRYRHFHLYVSLVARLQFVVIACHVGQEAQRRRRIAELPVFKEFQVFRLALDETERLQRLVDRREAVLETAAIVVDVLILHSR